MSTQHKWWIKERTTAQAHYYVAMGQLSYSEATSGRKSVYGCNDMHPFDTESAYRAKIAALAKAGESVQ